MIICSDLPAGFSNPVVSSCDVSKGMSPRMCGIMKHSYRKKELMWTFDKRLRNNHGKHS